MLRSQRIGCWPFQNVSCFSTAAELTLKLTFDGHPFTVNCFAADVGMSMTDIHKIITSRKAKLGLDAIYDASV